MHTRCSPDSNRQAAAACHTLLVQQVAAAGLAGIIASAGCSRACQQPDGVLSDDSHSHYHVHAPDVGHGHTHDDFPAGGHTHDHADH